MKNKIMKNYYSYSNDIIDNDLCNFGKYKMLKAIALIGVRYLLETIVGIARTNKDIFDWENQSEEKLKLIIGNLMLREHHIKRMDKMRAKIEKFKEKGEKVPRCEHKLRTLVTGCLSCFSRSFGMRYFAWISLQTRSWVVFR